MYIHNNMRTFSKLHLEIKIVFVQSENVMIKQNIVRIKHLHVPVM